MQLYDISNVSIINYVNFGKNAGAFYRDIE